MWFLSPLAGATGSSDVEESSAASLNNCITMGVDVSSDTSSEDVEQSSVASLPSSVCIVDSHSASSYVSSSSGLTDTWDILDFL